MTRAPRLAEDALHRGAVPGDHRPVVRRQPLEELAAHVVDPAQVGRVELAHRGDGLGERLAAEGRAGAPLHGVDRLQRVVQSQQVEVLQFGERPGQFAFGCRVLRITVLHVQPPPVQREVDGAGAEQRAQLLVVGLTLLPPRGDRGHLVPGSRQAQRPGHRVHRGPALRSEQDDPHDA